MENIDYSEDPRLKEYTDIEEVEDDETVSVDRFDIAEHRIYLDQDGVGTLVQNAALTRRAFIRAILNKRFGVNGISNIKEISDLMESHYITVIGDFKAIQAVKIKAKYRKKVYRFWYLPPITSNKLNLRKDQATVERMLARLLLVLGIDTYVRGSDVYINALPGSAKCLKHWFSMLIWPGLMGVMSDDDTCVLICASNSDAEIIHYRVTGYTEDQNTRER